MKNGLLGTVTNVATLPEHLPLQLGTGGHDDTAERPAVGTLASLSSSLIPKSSYMRGTYVDVAGRLGVLGAGRVLLPRVGRASFDASVRPVAPAPIGHIWMQQAVREHRIAGQERSPSVGGRGDGGLRCD